MSDNPPSSASPSARQFSIPQLLSLKPLEEKSRSATSGNGHRKNLSMSALSLTSKAANGNRGQRIVSSGEADQTTVGIAEEEDTEVKNQASLWVKEKSWRRGSADVLSQEDKTPITPTFANISDEDSVTPPRHPSRTLETIPASPQSVANHPVSPGFALNLAAGGVNDSPRRKARPSPIQVPQSPTMAASGNADGPGAWRGGMKTSTGIPTGRRISLTGLEGPISPGMYTPNGVTAPYTAGLSKVSGMANPQGFGGRLSTITTPRAINTNMNATLPIRKRPEHLPPPKSAAANFAAMRGLSNVTVRTSLLSPPIMSPTPNDSSAVESANVEHNASPPSASAAEAGTIEDGRVSARPRGISQSIGAGVATAGIKSSRSVEVDYLRNEMERAMKKANAEAGTEDSPAELVRNDIILCKFYHTPGLTCTARPCRFIHEFSPVTTPQKSSFPRTASPGSNGNEEGQNVGDVVEIVEVYPMSGGGGGPGSKYSREKYRTVPCRDWFRTGACPYGEFCSFIHANKDDQWVTAGGESGAMISPTEAAIARKLEKLRMQEPATHVAGGHVQPNNLHDFGELPILTMSESEYTDQDGTVGDFASQDYSRSSMSSISRTSSRPKSFGGSKILIPDLRWTTENGLTVSNPATAATPTFHQAAERFVESVISPSVASSPAQYAKAPALSAWGLGAHRGMMPNTANDHHRSPYLPISAYTFSTDASSPPITPAQELLNEANRRAQEHAALERMLQQPIPYLEGPYMENNLFNGMPTLSPGGINPNFGLQLPYVQPTIHDMASYPGSIGQIYPQQVPTAFDAIMKVAGKGKNMDEDARRLASQRLARLAKVAVPPQVVQDKMNYRTKPCKYWAQGECPRASNCSYLHDPSNKGIVLEDKPAPGNKRYRKEPCKFYNSAEGCKEGTNCHFAHQFIVPPGMPMMLRPRPWRTKPCRHFQQQRCLAGDNCHFAHVYIDEEHPEGLAA